MESHADRVWVAACDAKPCCTALSTGRLPKFYWYKFMWQGKLVRESTKLKNGKGARDMEAVHRTSLAKGEVGIREKKSVPKLEEFIDKRFEPWAKAQFTSRPKT